MSEEILSRKGVGKTLQGNEIVLCKEELYKRERALRETNVRSYIVALANSGVRTGELEQFQWRDLIDYRKTDDYGKTREIVYLQVRAETSKVRKDKDYSVETLIVSDEQKR